MTDLSTVVNAADVTDLVYDDANGILYLSTTTGEILRWNPSTGSFLSPLDAGGNPSSIALTADNAFLLIAEGTEGGSFGAVDRFSLSDGSNAGLSVQNGGYGVSDLAIAANGRAIITQSGGSTGPLEFLAETASSVGSTSLNMGGSSNTVPYNSKLSTSEDGRYVLITENVYQPAAQWLYDSQSDHVVQTFSSAPLTGSADINSHDGLIAEQVGSGVNIYNLQFSLTKTLSLPNSGTAIAVQFSADGSELFVLDGSGKTIDIFDTSSWNLTGSIQLTGVTDTLYSGKMAVSADGKFLFVDTDSALESIDLSANPTAAPTRPAYQSGYLRGTLVNIPHGSATAPTSTSTHITSDHTVTADQHLAYDETHSPVFIRDASANVTVNGSVNLSSTTTNVLLTGMQDSFSASSAGTLTVASGASWTVHANGSGSVAVGVSSALAFQNHGTWSVSATTQAYGVSELSGSTFNNSGSFSVSGDAAVGYWSTGSSNFTNTGTYTVTGTSAALGAQLHSGQFTNTGTVTVTDQDGGSVAFELTGSYSLDTRSSFSNQGTITADTALLVYSTDYSPGDPGDMPVVLVTNSGTINGALDLGGGYPLLFTMSGGPGGQVVNTGAINGAIHFDDGAALYDGLGGTQIGGIYLGAGTDKAILGNDGETVYGGTGADDVIGGAGNDVFNGSVNGSATFSYENATSGVHVSLGTSGPQATGGAGTDTLVNVSDLVGSAYNDTLTGSGPHQTLEGGAGNDVLVAGAGSEVLDGGPGVDTAVYSGNYASYTITPSGSGYTVSGPDGADTLTNIEILKFADRQVILGHNAETLSLQASDFLGNGVSDFLIENTGGVVFVGEAQNGQAAYTQVAGLGPEWSFHGRGDFLGDGDSDFLIQNTSGAVAVGDVHNGQTSYTVVAGLGSEWSFKGTGDFLGDGKSDFLIENTSGSVVVGEVVSGHAQYTAVAGLGPEWSFRGTGDFLGNGKSDFLIENTSGVVAVGEVAGGQAQYTAIASLGHEWSFKETGDFLGDGKDDFLIENTGGSVVVGEAVGGQAQYTAITSLGPEWKFVGAGDYLGEGHDQFLIENSSGAIDIGDWTGGQIHFTNIAGLGPEWVFH